MNISNCIPILDQYNIYGTYLTRVLDSFTNIETASDESAALKICFKDWVSFSEMIPGSQRMYTMDYQPRAVPANTNSVHYVASKVKQFIFMQYPCEYWALIMNDVTKPNSKNIKFEGVDDLSYREQYSYKGFIGIKDTMMDVPANGIIINLGDLLYDFKTTLINLTKDLGLTLTERMDVIMQNHNEMLSKQENLIKNQNINIFLNDFINHNDCDLPLDSSLIDEAYIQWFLREKHIELRCNDFGDNFPKTTKELWEYAYYAQDYIH